MDNVPKMPRKPVAAIAGQHLWLVRSLESIFTTAGYTVATHVGSDIADWLETTKPDILVLEADPADGPWAFLLTAARSVPCVTPATPILVATADSLTRGRRMDALKAGAWDVFGSPLDSELLILKANAFAAAKLEAEAARDRSLVDAETDFYNVRGVLRRIGEEASEAARLRRPLACLVASLEPPTGEPSEGPGPRVLAEAFRKASRSSDVFGWLGPNEFIVVAPGTDSPGARRFAERLVRMAGPGAGATEPGPRSPLRAGIAAVADVSDSAIEPVDLFVRAVTALRAAQASDASDFIQSYD